MPSQIYSFARVFVSSVVLMTAHGARANAAEPKSQLLWPQGAPDAVGAEDRDKPAITVWQAPADKANGAAVVVCPGGGYAGLADTYEGHDVAQWLNTLGVAGIVLKYRLAPRYHHPAPLQDAQRALRTVRARAREWAIDPHRIGILGFSAGGHLASTTATHFDGGRPEAPDPIDREGCRPTFAILCYPVISFTTRWTHQGSKNNLLGKDADPKLVESLSNELHVTDKTPPTFLFHTTADTGVPPENSTLFYMALTKAKVPAELHIYQKGKHGVGLAQNDPALASWPGLCADWLRTNGWLEPAKAKAADPVKSAEGATRR
jgi:acetyl esterase/lipase